MIQAAPPGTFPRADLVGDDDHSDDAAAPPPDTGGDDDAAAEEPAVPTVFNGLASTTGNTDPATRWIVPGIGVVPAAETSLWIINPSGDQATVTITPLGAASAGPDKIIVPPGWQVEIPFAEVTESGTSGVIIDATVPISAALSISSPRGVAFIGGIPVG